MDAGKPEPLGWWFETTRFENAPEVEEEVNPGRFGESLAEWLAGGLRRRGWDVRDVFWEDWGWVVSVHRGSKRFFVDCGNEDGSVVRWGVFPKARVGLLRRLFSRSPTTPDLAELDDDIGDIISADEGTTWSGRKQPG